MATQLIAGELPGTYVVPEAVTDTELMRLAKMLARRRLKRGRSMENPDAVFNALQTPRVRQLSTEFRLFYTPKPSIHAGSRFLDA